MSWSLKHKIATFVVIFIVTEVLIFSVGYLAWLFFIIGIVIGGGAIATYVRAVRKDEENARLR